jgi:hypothetical protein
VRQGIRKALSTTGVVAADYSDGGARRQRSPTTFGRTPDSRASMNAPPRLLSAALIVGLMAAPALSQDWYCGTNGRPIVPRTVRFQNTDLRMPFAAATNIFIGEQVSGDRSTFGIALQSRRRQRSTSPRWSPPTGPLGRSRQRGAAMVRAARSGAASPSVAAPWSTAAASAESTVVPSRRTGSFGRPSRLGNHGSLAAATNPGRHSLCYPSRSTRRSAEARSATSPTRSR